MSRLERVREYEPGGGWGAFAAPTFNGGKETRTPDPLHAMQVLYQLSYAPVILRVSPQARSRFDPIV